MRDFADDLDFPLFDVEFPELASDWLYSKALE